MKRLMLLVIGFALLLVVNSEVRAQNTISVATPAEQAKMKPLIEAETKAREALNAKIAALPEAEAVRKAKEVYDKALQSLNAAAETLKENNEWKTAGAAVLDAAYAIQADHKLSSREYKPQLNIKGELEFAKLDPQKP